MCRSIFILAGLLALSACAQYQPSEAECFSSFAEVTRSNCNFELLGPIGSPAGASHG